MIAVSAYAFLLLVLTVGIVAVFAVELVGWWRHRRRSPWRVTLRRRRQAALNPPAWVNDGKPVAVQPHELTDVELRRALRAYQAVQVGAALEYQRLLRERATRHVAASGTAAAERHAQGGGA